MAHIDVFKSWADTIRQDIEAFKALLESPKADDESRKLAGGALSYLVSKMDLIPDWNEGIGVIDDVMVLRVCAQLAVSAHTRPSMRCRRCAPAALASNESSACAAAGASATSTNASSSLMRACG